MKWFTQLAIVVGAVLCLPSPARAQGFTVNLPPDAFMIKLTRGLENGNMALPSDKAQGPALNGITYLESDTKTAMMQLKLESRPQDLATAQLKEKGYLFVRYLVFLKDLDRYFDYDKSKILHTAPDLKADRYCKVSKGEMVPGSDSMGVAGLSAGRYIAYCHSRSLRGVKFGFWDSMKVMSGSFTVDSYEYEKEMTKYWTEPDPQEWVIIDVVADALPLNDKVVVDSVKARVWGLSDESYVPYTKAKLTMHVLGLDLTSDPQDGLPSVRDYLTQHSKAFKSKGVLEKIFLDGMKESMGSFLAMQPSAPATN